MAEYDYDDGAKPYVATPAPKPKPVPEIPKPEKKANPDTDWPDRSIKRKK